MEARQATVAASARRRELVGAALTMSSLPLFPLAVRVAWPFGSLRLGLLLVAVPVTLASEGLRRWRQARAAMRPGVRLPAQLCWLEKREGWVFKRVSTEYWITLGEPPLWTLEVEEADAERLPDEPTLVVHSAMRRRAAAALTVGEEVIWPISSLRTWIPD